MYSSTVAFFHWSGTSPVVIEVFIITVMYGEFLKIAFTYLHGISSIAYELVFFMIFIILSMGCGLNNCLIHFLMRYCGLKCDFLIEEFPVTFLKILAGTSNFCDDPSFTAVTFVVFSFDLFADFSF